ncbi:YopX family protein [Streptococcus suis]|nr:YopX family protein [Streptococcus suis]MDG3109159.1 YopX family protein [Streptococcus suis]MDG3147983.1 YopX family protein [Streptococcus suis]MDG3170303.1 YopX family protein [Streptococcus suis]MDG3228678.1 YopX family protein [Streptococcus suis]MDG3327678.1 YopX family protein [Streptococcus suis]
MIVARDYRELAELFAGLDADDSLYSDPMHSTGLFDKNGDEIFESDAVVVYDELIEFGPGVYEVVYSHDNLAWMFYDKENRDFCFISTCTWDELEIIGNIYENPELVEG